MPRPEYHPITLIIAFVALCLTTRVGFAAPPNIVLILIDDLGWPDVGCYGNAFHETPHIDQLAAQGVRFTDFYAACPVCSPTRASIQSGQSQSRVGITDFIPGHWRPFETLVVPEVAGHLPLEIITPAEHLHQAGYTSAYFGKWHLGGVEQNPDKQGYDTSIVTSGRHFAPRFQTMPKTPVARGTYLADFLTGQTLAFIEEHKSEPFFVQLSHYAVHIPLEAKPETIAKYEGKPKPDNRVNNTTYAAMVEHVDESVGRVLATLDRLGIAENTVVVFTSDNGGLRSSYRGGEIVSTNAPLRDEKGTLYEGGIRVPLIVRWPATIAAGGLCREPTITVDLWPTFSELAGLALPPNQTIDGVSLVSLLTHPGSRLDRDAIFWHYPHYHHMDPSGAVRMRDWKLIEHFDDGALELYNLAGDLSETTNLAGLLPEKARAMQQRLRDWRPTVDARMPTKNPKSDPARAHEWWSRRTDEPVNRQRK